MKAAILTAFDPYTFRGGIERYTLQLIALLKERNISADIFHIGLVENDPGFHNPFLGKIYVLGQMFRRIDINYDIMIANSFYGLGYFAPRIESFTIYHASHVAFDKSIEGVISYATSLEWTYLCGYLGEVISGYNRARIAVSEVVREELERYYGFDDVRVVESCVDTDLFQPRGPKRDLRTKYSLNQDSFIGLFVGRWDKTKGKDVIEKLAANTPDIHWLLVLGTGGEECILRNAANVTVLEEVPYEEMPLIYSLSDFVLFPSRYEGCGLVILEAMACGLPVLAGDVGIARKIFRESPFASLKLPIFPTEQTDEAIDDTIRKIHSLRDNKERRAYISAAGVELVKQRYHIDLWKTNMLKALGLN